MKYTKETIQQTFDNYRELLELAEVFARGKGSYRRIQFDESGNIEEYVNTACHCHPEYEWQQLATAEEFHTWLEKRQKEEGE